MIWYEPLTSAYGTKSKFQKNRDWNQIEIFMLFLILQIRIPIFLKFRICTIG